MQSGQILVAGHLSDSFLQSTELLVLSVDFPSCWPSSSLPSVGYALFDSVQPAAGDALSILFRLDVLLNEFLVS